jgi:N-acetylmuramoyl-L-alanine amidase
MSKVVILDAGHGGELNGVYQTSGKRSPVWEDGTQYFEGVGNRQIANITRKSVFRACIGLDRYYLQLQPSDHTDVTLSLVSKYRSNAHFKMNPTAFQISIHSNGFSNESGKRLRRCLRQ